MVVRRMKGVSAESGASCLGAGRYMALRLSYGHTVRYCLRPLGGCMQGALLFFCEKHKKKEHKIIKI